MNAHSHLPLRGRQASPWLALCLTLLSVLFSARVHSQGVVPCPTNIDFNLGNLNSWSCYTGIASTGPAGAAAMTGTTFSGPITRRHTVMTGAALDKYGNFPVVAPGGLFSLKLGNDSNGGEAERVRYFVHVPVGFNNYSFAFRYAVVFEDPGESHDTADKPSFQIAAYDSATNLPIAEGCAWQTFVAGGNLPGFQISTISPFPQYLPWTNGTLNLSGQGGKTIVVEVTAFDCTLGGHFGYGYFDVISCGQFQAALTHCNLDEGTVTLEAPAGYAAYKWYRGPVISGSPFSMTRSTNLPSVPLTPTFYYCVLTPYSGPECNDTIRTKLISDFTMDATPDEVCNSLGKPLALSVTASGGLNDFNYEWFPHPALSPIPNAFTGKLNPTSPNASVTASPYGRSTIIVRVTDSVGCFRQDTVRVQDPTFKANLGPDITTCLNTPVTLNPTITPASPGYIYAWSPKTNLSDTTILKPKYTPVRTGTETFILRVDSGVCATTDTINIRTIPDTFATYNEAVCERDVFNARVETESQYQDLFTYSWSPSTYLSLGSGNNRRPSVQPDSSVIYTVTMSYPGCPDVKKTLSVRVEPLPRVNVGPDTIAKCFYIPLHLTADVQPTWFSNYTYSWKANDHLDNTTTPMVRFTGNEDTTLIVTVRTPLGCRGVDSIRVKAYGGEFGAVTPDDTAVCPRNEIHFAASGGVSYRWIPSDYLSDSTSANVTARPPTSIDYKLYVTDKNGCIDTLPVYVQVYSEAVVSLPDSAVLFPGESMQMAPGGNGFYFDWFPTVGLNNPGISNPIASPGVNTRYFVTATTEAGCVATDSIYVLVHQQSAIDVPNAFVPGNGPNGAFKVAHAGIAALKSFRIYNRWGSLIFETKDISKGWDGLYNGQPQPMGVYVYTVEATGTEGQVLTKSGNVTLIR